MKNKSQSFIKFLGIVLSSAQVVLNKTFCMTTKYTQPYYVLLPNKIVKYI